MRVDILRAQPAFAPFLKAIALESKGYWGYPPEWLAEWRRRLQLTPEYVERTETWYAVVDGQAAGFYSLIVRDELAELDHLWLVPGLIRGGLGRHLFEHAVAQARRLGCTRLTLEADPNAVGFYERMGARTVGTTKGDMGRDLPVMELVISAP